MAPKDVALKGFNRAQGTVESISSAMDTNIGCRAFSLFSRLLMAADMVSDYAVTASLYKNNKAAFPLAVILCLLPLGVLSLVLFRPAYRMHSRAFSLDDISNNNPTHFIFPLPYYAFIVLWIFFSPGVVIILDVALLTLYACIDPQRTAQLIYYERLRMLTEVLFESIPQSLFQLSLARAEPIIIISVLISWMSLATHIIEMRKEAKERNVSMTTHLFDVLSAGFGVLPFIGAIRERRLESASYADLPLVSKDITALLTAIEDGANLNHNKKKKKKRKKKNDRKRQGFCFKHQGVEKENEKIQNNNIPILNKQLNGLEKYGCITDYNLSMFSINELRLIINKAELSYSDCIERSELIQLGEKAKQKLIENFTKEENLSRNSNLNDDIVASDDDEDDEVKFQSIDGSLTSLDLSNIGFTEKDCSEGMRLLLNYLSQRKLGGLKHLAVDRNQLKEQQAKLIGGAIADAAKKAQLKLSNQEKKAIVLAPPITSSSSSSSSHHHPLLFGVLVSIVIEDKVINLSDLIMNKEVDFSKLDLMTSLPQITETPLASTSNQNTITTHDDTGVINLNGVNGENDKVDGLMATLEEGKQNSFEGILPPMKPPPFLERLQAERDGHHRAANLHARWCQSCLSCVSLCCCFCCQFLHSSSSSSSSSSSNKIQNNKKSISCESDNNDEEKKENNFTTELDDDNEPQFEETLQVTNGLQGMKRSLLWKCSHCECLKNNSKTQVVPEVVTTIQVQLKKHEDEQHLTPQSSPKPSKSNNTNTTSKNHTTLPKHKRVQSQYHGIWGFTESALALAVLTANTRIVHLTLKGVILSSNSSQLSPLLINQKSKTKNQPRQEQHPEQLEEQHSSLGGSGDLGQVAGSTARALASALKEMVTLRVLDVRGCNLDRLSKRYLADSITLLAATNDPSSSSSSSKQDINDGESSSSSSSDDDDNDDEDDNSEDQKRKRKHRKQKNKKQCKKDEKLLKSIEITKLQENDRKNENTPGLRYFACDEWCLLQGTASLILDGYGLVDEDALLLSALLRKNTDLLVLSLRNNRIRASGERALASVIRHHNRTLLSLDLSGCKRVAAGVALTEAALTRGATLATLSGIPILAIKTGEMREVDLSHRSITAEGWAVLLASLEMGRKTIQHVNLSNTTIMSSGLTSNNKLEISNGFIPILSRKSCSIQYLNLNSCGLLISTNNNYNNNRNDITTITTKVPISNEEDGQNKINRNNKNSFGDSFMLSLAKIIPKNKFLLRICFQGLGLSSLGKLGLAGSILASNKSKAPLCSIACDEWDLKQNVKYLKLSPWNLFKNNDSSSSSWKDCFISMVNKEKQLNIDKSNCHIDNDDNECKPFEHDDESIVDQFGYFGCLNYADFALLFVLLGNHKKALILDLDADVFEVARSSDLSTLLDPPHGHCNLKHLIISMNTIQRNNHLDKVVPSSFPTEFDQLQLMSNTSASGTYSATNTPRDEVSPDSGLSALISGLRENKSLVSFQLSLRPCDLGLIDTADDLADSAALLKKNTIGGGGGGGGGGVGGGGITWISSLGDAFDLNNTLSDLVIRGDAVALGAYTNKLTEVLIRAKSLKVLEFQLLGSMDMSPPPNAVISNDNDDDKFSSDKNKQNKKNSKKKNQKNEENPYQNNKELELFKTRKLWLQIESNIINNLIPYIECTESLKQLSIHLLVPGFNFLDFGKSKISSIPYGLKYLSTSYSNEINNHYQLNNQIYGYNLFIKMLTHSQQQISCFYHNENIFSLIEDKNWNYQIPTDLCFETSVVSLCQAAQPSSSSSSSKSSSHHGIDNNLLQKKKGIKLKLNGILYGDLKWMDENEANIYLSNIKTKIDEEKMIQKNEEITASNLSSSLTNSTGTNQNQKKASTHKPIIRNVRKAAANITGFRGFFSGSKQKQIEDRNIDQKINNGILDDGSEEVGGEQAGEELLRSKS